LSSVIVVIPILGLNPLGGEVSTAMYKPGLQAHYLVKKMAEFEKTVIDAISALTEKLVTPEKNMDSYGGDLIHVQEKVDVAIQSISLVQ
jgi:hypothetical protein